MKVLNLEFSQILNFYKNIEPTEGRGKIHKIYRYKKKFNFIDESYNANPLSMKESILNLSKINIKNIEIRCEYNSK